MLNENAKLWVAALRSGEYTQTRGRLSIIQAEAGSTRFVVGDCCLGVACKVAHKAGLALKLDSIGRMGDGKTIEATYDGEISVLPESVAKWLGLTNLTGPIAVKDLPEPIRRMVNASAPQNFEEGKTFLTVLNDTLGLTLSQIADIIESEPEGLFGPPPVMIGGPA